MGEKILMNLCKYITAKENPFWWISLYTSKGLFDMYFPLYYKGCRITWGCLVALSHLSCLLVRDLYINIWGCVMEAKRQVSLRKELDLGTRPPPELLHFSSLLLSVHLSHSSCCRLAFFWSLSMCLNYDYFSDHISLGQTLRKRLNKHTFFDLDSKFPGSFVTTPGPINKDDSLYLINLRKRQNLVKRWARQIIL